jgi:hypothetical protein
MLVRPPQRPRHPGGTGLEREAGPRRSDSGPPAVVLITRGCDRARGCHVDYAHSGRVDRCLCGWDERPCHGDCGLSDCSWLTVRTEMRA